MTLGVDPRLPNLGAPNYDRNLHARLYELFRGILGKFNQDGSFSPAQLSDAAAKNNSVYYSTDGNKLRYRDPSGTAHDLY